ncbi:SusC/RagA family TonB-linked outer membrane protein [Ferruginibacter albus]|uniref:SusC/RagA family TonB-linked outer membrane protein n=1 Tax=Ferruginibacter albus TaxID=2875540 RepID=UPI001CC3850D|nr:SusC/RagA family TonB-linked outer membrane protein [Ferruginibacter albus]UAY52362.1 SusC/RagA family TonB-linked outer membrane protein [Ferruginibacter albus]
MRKIALLLTVLLCSTALVFAQSQVKGKVTDSKDGSPLSSISVKVKGTTSGASTAADGSFTVDITGSSATLEISGVGFTPKTIKVSAGETVSVSLEKATQNLTEVVVTALGIKREKRQLTYSTQEVNGESVVQAKQDNLVNALAGKVSGVSVINSSGMPGSPSRIVIRGATSLLGENQPLFVIDGVPISNEESGAIDVFGQGANNVRLNQGSTSNRAIDLDPSIIESVNVLKGGAATALYGAQAARGAIIITTKTGGGKSSKPTVSISSSLKFDNAILAEYQNKYSQGLDGLFINGSIQGTASSQSWGARVDTLKVDGSPVKTYDPRAIFFRTGKTTDNNISISGGSEKSNYLISYSYLNNEGIIPTTAFTRNAFFAKFSNQITSNLTANIEINYVNTVNDRTQEGNGLSNPIWAIYPAPITWDPLPATWPDGTQRLYRTLSRNNPFFVLDNSGFQSTVNRFIPVASFVYTPTKWLTITERVGTDIFADNSRYYEASTINNGVFSGAGGVSNRLEDYRQFNHDFIISFHKELSKDLYGSLLLGNNLLSQFTDTYVQSGVGLALPGFYNISNAGTILSSDNVVRYRKVGYYAQANLEYKKMLDLSLTGRYDGTSVLNPDKQYYPYGSAGLGFIFTELMNKSDAFSFGKVRISYSAVGNDNLSPYSLSTPFLLGTNMPAINNVNFPYNGVNGAKLTTALGNPNLINESLNEFEVGLELKFLKNRLSFDGSYFDRESKNLLSQTPIASTSGFFTGFQNVGQIQNKGIEFLISGNPVKTKNFTWDVNLNFTRIRSKVITLGPGVNSIQLGGFGNAGVFLFKDQPYGILYGLQYVRNDKGQIEVGDDGLPISSTDFGPIGNTNPDFTMGLSNTFTYKRLSLSFLIDYKKGGDILNLDDNYMWFYGTSKITEANRDKPFVVGNSVYASSGLPNTTPVSAQDYWSTISSITESNIEDGTYVKLRNVTAAYTFGAIRKTPFKSLTISFSGNNLWFYLPHYTGSDPEASVSGGDNGQGVTNFQTPTTRSYIVGVKATF